MSEAASRYHYALSVWKKRWIAKKKRELFLIVALGICFTAFIGATYVLNPNRDSILAMLFTIAVFTLFIIHEIKLLRKQKAAQVTIVNGGFLTEKKTHSQHEIVRGKHTRGCYVTIQTPSGVIAAICDSHTYACSNIGDPLLILKAENDSATYAVALQPD